MEKDFCQLNDDQLEQIVAGKSWNVYPQRKDGTCPICRETKLETRTIYTDILIMPCVVNELPYCPRCGVGFMRGVNTLTELPLITKNGELYVKC